jgi:hypothetical protein
MIRRIATGLSAVVLAAWFAYSAFDAFPRQLGIDFYQFWGVPLAREAASLERTPYVDSSMYALVLNTLADSSPNVKFHEANRLRRTLEPMGTPFLYAAFSVFPASYEPAQALFTALLYATAGMAIFGLARLRGLSGGEAVCVAFLVMLTFNPFAQDVRSGNVNSLQLAFVVALVAISARGAFSRRAWLDGLYVGSLALFVLFKPNTPWIALALGIHYAALRGMRAFAIGAIEGVVLAGIAIAVGAWQMGGIHAWPEWFQLARGMDGSALLFTLDRGNLSVGMALSRVSPALGAVGWGLAMAGVLAVALVVALSPASTATRSVLAAGRRAFADPWFAVTVGIAFTFATSPLVWPHYYVLALVPMAWLVSPGRRSLASTVGAIACYLVLSRLVIDPLAARGAYGPLQAFSVAAWLALLPGMFTFARAAAQGAGTPPAPAAATRGT